MGRALNMGPGYFPIVLSSILMMVGLIVIGRSFIVLETTPFGVVPWRAIVMLTASTVLFALYLAQLGLFPAVLLASALACLASSRIKPVSALVTGLFISCFCWLVFKAIVERAIGRLATRSVLAFTAIPINALWNGLVCWFVLREARIRVMGPSAASEMLDVVFRGEPAPSPALLTTIHCALGAAVVRTSELHPNHISLMRELRQRFGEPAAGVEVDDTRVFLQSLARLSHAERCTALRVLTIAAIQDGRLVKRERRLLLEAYHTASIAPALEQVELLRKAFVRGDPILGPELLASAS
jgi:hypothetical protein